MLRCLTWLFFSLWVISGSMVRSADLPDIDIPYQKFVLPNGLRVIVHEDRKTPIVAVNVWYHVGSKDESPGRTGFAHLFEHLMFNGSEHYNQDYFKALEPLGATRLNGNTWLDRTVYFQNVPKNALDTVLWLESDRMGHLLGVIDQAKLDEQRGVVQNEKRQGENQPYGKVSELIAASTYPSGHPYSWDTIGSMADLNAASLEDVKKWFRRYYGAANAVVVLAGDITLAQAQKKMQLYFGDIAPGPPLQRQRSWIAKMSGVRRATLQDNVPQARLYKTWNIPGYQTSEFALLDLTTDILANGKNSRLYKRLVYQEQTATAVSASVGPFELGSQFQLVVTLKPGADINQVERAVDEELALYLKTGPTPQELLRTQTAGFAAFTRAIERIDGASGKANILAQSEVIGGSPDFYQRYLTWIRDATVPELQKVAQQWLADGVFVLQVTPRPSYQIADTGASRAAAPQPGPPPTLQLPTLQRATLSNGLRITFARRDTVPLLNLKLLFNAGYAADRPAQAGLAKLALAMLDEGTRRRSALEIAERAELLGAQLSAASDLDTSYLGLNALTARLEDSLELFADILLEPQFPSAELQRLQAQMLAGIEQEKAQPQALALRLLPQFIYGTEHSYGKPLSGNGYPATVAAITRDDLQQFRDQWLRPDNAQLLVVGNSDLETLVPLLERHLGKWRASAVPQPQKVLKAPAVKSQAQIYLVDRPQSEQSVIVVGRAGAARGADEYPTLDMLNTVLSGNFVSRLNMNLREDKRWSYGVGSSLVPAQGASPWLIRTAVQADKTAPALQEIQRELQDIATVRPPSAAELQFARDSTILQLPGANETLEELTLSYSDILLHGLSDDYWNTYAARLQRLTTENLKTDAAQWLSAGRFTWVIVGDLQNIEAEIRKLDIGTVRVIDADGKVLR
jgi:zinc protease